VQTHLSAEFKDTREGEQAAAIIGNCVHCGFCTATCPTYQLLGDELDGPRGRIYLIKQVLEGADVTRSTQLHLDRCLTCRNCETTCPSGVQYGALLEIGRDAVDERVRRPLVERAARALLRVGLTSRLFAPAFRLGQRLRALLPARLRRRLPAYGTAPGELPTRQHARKILLLPGCVQPAMLPNINAATARVLDAAGIQTIVPAASGCCGALRSHLSDRAGGLADMRHNIDVWWPQVNAGEVEAIVSNASACALAIKEYACALADDAHYAHKAQRISALSLDLSELLPELVARLEGSVRTATLGRLAFHAPCTLQHGQQLRGLVEGHLRTLGFEISVARDESHLCCGSAGAYSVLQPALAQQLRDRKLACLSALQAQCIVSANVGCILHLQSGTTTPVKHWIEVLDQALTPPGVLPP
jgi:glycolate oxidase iron-sulfur subunit